MVEQTYAAEEQRKAATADRYPDAQGGRGLRPDIGVNFGTSHGTVDATGTRERAGVQGIRTARRSGTGAVAAGHADGRS